MGTDEAYYLLGYGVEGENYVFDENGNPSVGDLGDDSFVGVDGQILTQLRNLVYFNTADETEVRFPDYNAPNSGKLISPVSYARAAENMPWQMAVGSGIMPTPNADVQRYYEQGIAEFLSGARVLSEENWQSFIDGFLRMGGQAWNDEGVAFMQEQNLLV